MTAEFRRQIEGVLRRPLAEDEWEPASALETLSRRHLAVLRELKRRDVIIPNLYLRCVLPQAPLASLYEFANVVSDASEETTMSSSFDNEALFEFALGRELSAAEKNRVASLDELSVAHRALAAMLCERDVDIATLCIVSVVTGMDAKKSRQWISATFGPDSANR